MQACQSARAPDSGLAESGVGVVPPLRFRATQASTPDRDADCESCVAPDSPINLSYIPSQHALISSGSLTIPFLFLCSLSLFLSLSLPLSLSLSLSLFSLSLSLSLSLYYNFLSIPTSVSLFFRSPRFCYVFKSLDRYVWNFALFT